MCDNNGKICESISNDFTKFKNILRLVSLDSDRAEIKNSIKQLMEFLWQKIVETGKL
jgi:hypothetical protein